MSNKQHAGDRRRRRRYTQVTARYLPLPDAWIMALGFKGSVVAHSICCAFAALTGRYEVYNNE